MPPSRVSSAPPRPSEEMRAGILDIGAPALAGVPIGLLFGAVAAGKGLSVAEVALMSALVFAGGAQFAAIEIWTSPVPVLAIIVSTLLINARHVLMGASLARKLGAFPPRSAFGGVALMADENWALAERRATRRPLTPAYWFSMSVTFWTVWVTSATVGALVGTRIGEPERFGADFVFTAVFIALIAGFWRGRTTGFVVAASGSAAAGASLLFGSPWHVLAGASAGIAVAALASREDAR